MIKATHPEAAGVNWLRLPALIKRRANTSRSSTYRHVAAGLLPPPVKLGPNTSAWPEHEIDAIDRARLAGASDSDIRALVIELVNARRAAA